MRALTGHAGAEPGDPRERDRTRRFFNRFAAAFHVIDLVLLKDYRRALAELDLPKELSVLDLGTGTGTLIMAFSERGHRVTGVDFAERLLRRARRRLPHADLRLMDLVDLGSIEDGAFDIVAMAYTLHGLSPELRRLALGQARRLARRHVLVIDYAAPGPWLVRLIERIEGPYYPSFVARPVPELLAEAGLQVERQRSRRRHNGWWLSTPTPSTADA